jgi:hypothetical protein
MIRDDPMNNGESLKLLESDSYNYDEEQSH